MDRPRRKREKELRRRARKARQGAGVQLTRKAVVLRTPRNITPEIESFAASIVGDSPSLTFNSIEAVPEAQLERCHQNVGMHCDKNGGEAVFGWSIWECDLWIEAEFHSVWRDDHGLHHDITPDRDGESKRLFVEDRSRKWDPVTKRAQPRRYFAKTKNRHALKFIDIKKQQESIRTKYAADAPLSHADQTKYRSLEEKSRRTLAALAPIRK